MAAPRVERFVAGSVARSIDFLNGHGPAEGEELRARD
jgi:hypothetical protein